MKGRLIFWLVAAVLGLLVFFPLVRAAWIAAFWLAQAAVAILFSAFILWLVLLLYRQSRKPRNPIV